MAKRALIESTVLDPVYYFLVFDGKISSPQTRCIYASGDKPDPSKTKYCYGWLIPDGYDPKGKTVREISQECRFVL